MSPSRPRRIVLQLTLVCLIALTIICVATAFMGAERTRALVNSAAFSPVWVALILLFAAGFLFAPRSMLRPGNLALHVGCLLIIIGGVLGSETGHHMAARLWHSQRVHDLPLRIPLGGTARPPELDFAVRLHDFYVAYYPTDEPWQLVAAATRRGEEPETTTIPMREGARVPLPFAHAEIEITNAVTWLTPESREMLLVEDSAGGLTRLPLSGQTDEVLQATSATIRVVHRFENLRVRRTDGTARVVNVPGAGHNPAIEIEWTPREGEAKRAIAFPPNRVAASVPPEDGVQLAYIPPARNIRGLEPPRAFLMRFFREGKCVASGWVASGLYDHGRLSLAALYGSRREWMADGAPTLHLVRPEQQPSKFLSDVGILKGEEEVARESIEVNHPLRYRGYRIYQISYDKENHQFSVLKVRSDSGLAFVYWGFALLIGGLVWRFWGRPLIRRERGATHGD